MNIVIVSDAWLPQVNGVVRTLQTVARELGLLGHPVHFVTPDKFTTFPCPTYPEIRLAVFPGPRMASLIEAAQPCAVHIATEGPLGWAARRYCLRRKIPFTTAVHTKFPEYIRARAFVPLALGYAVLRWFHKPATRTMVATDSLRDELHARGFGRLSAWSRGVDLDVFHPRPSERDFLNLPRPIFLYVGRVAVEKNISAFLALDLPGSKLVVGDGPQMDSLKKKHPEVHFAGAQFGEDLARHYAAGDVFVFPSLTDTFGLVLIEALASGLPVAAYPVTGPRDVLAGAPVGVLDNDLRAAALAALKLDPAACRTFAERYSWRGSAEQFHRNLAPFC